MMKKEVKLFFLTDFEQEEEYLTAMHRKGWKWRKIRLGCLFLFEACKPAEVAYRLDFKPRLGENSETYYQLYADHGWEYIGVCNNFVYFRKTVKDGEAVDIYSDRQTKLDMIGRMFKWRFVVMLLLSLSVFWRAFDAESFLSVWTVLSVVYLFVLLHCGIGFYKLRRRYAERD